MLAKNESQMDRAIRLIVGLVLLVVGSQLSGWLQIVLYILAIIALLTAATGVCFLYKLLGLDSTKMKGTAEPKAEETAKPEPEAEEVKTEEPAEAK